jgi:protein-S-isoprenylcysteine O-methyltransferase Ste14
VVKSGERAVNGELAGECCVPYSLRYAAVQLEGNWLVPNRELQRSMYEHQGPSLAQRVSLAILAAFWLATVWWLLFGTGLQTIGHWLGRAWHPGDPLRRLCLALALSIYYVRILFTEFVFLKRGVSWSEVFTIAPWLLFIFLLFAISGGTNSAAIGVAGVLGIALFLAGSCVNSFAEYQRHVWKQRPECRGQLFTQGLFRYSRHPNYLGDLLSFTGICLLSGAWITLIIPLLMLAGFVVVNIPVLDSHLHDHYGPAFDDYAGHTPKLIPFLC